MNTRQLAALACRILGLIALLRAFEYSSILFWSAMDEGDGAFLTRAAPAILLLALGLIFLTGARWIGELLAGRSNATDSTVLSVPRGFEVVAIAMVGIFDLLSSAPALVNQVLYAAQESEVELASSYDPGLVGSALRVALGQWLVLGSRGWSNVLRNLRNAGLDPDERPWE